MKMTQEIMNKKLNILYSRVSSISQQDNTSLSYQQNNLEDYCKANNISNYVHITDVESGAKTRKGIKEIKELIELKLVDTIYITKLDRLYRSIIKGSAFIKYCIDNNVNIKTSLETTDTTTSSGMLSVHLLMSISEYERVNIADRCWNGKVERFNSGNRSQGVIAIGYNKENNNLVVNQNESKIVNTIFQSYNKLKSLSKVQSHLKRLNIRTKRNLLFTRKSIYNILTNKFYIGLVHLRGEYKNGTHQPIISKNLFTRVNNQLSSNNKRG